MSGRVKHRKRGPVDYRRTPRRRPPRLDFALDQTLLAQLRQPSADGKHLSPIGKCHECERPVSGERRFCGPCVVKRGRQ